VQRQEDPGCSRSSLVEIGSLRATSLFLTSWAAHFCSPGRSMVKYMRQPTSMYVAAFRGNIRATGDDLLDHGIYEVPCRVITHVRVPVTLINLQGYPLPWPEGRWSGEVVNHNCVDGDRRLHASPPRRQP